MSTGEVSKTSAIVALVHSIALLCAGPDLFAQQLALRHYDLRDGLAHSRVISIYQDRKGYLWFGTWEGLSRFDGYRFTNYETRDGLGNIVVNAITEHSNGTLWIATNGGGVSRLIDDPTQNISTLTGTSGARQKFISFPVGDSPGANRVNAMLFDSKDNFWCATDAGLYRASKAENGNPVFEVVVPHSEVAEQMCAFADSRGRLWFGIKEELLEVVDGAIVKYGAAEGAGRPISVIEDNQHRVLTVNSDGVHEFVEPTDIHSKGRWKKWPVILKPDQGVSQMIADSNGRLWIATAKGLIKYKDTQRVYTVANGLSGDRVTRLLEDREGNLWIGTWSSGVCKLSGEMILSFTRAEGLPDQDIVKAIEDQRGRIYASTYQGGLVEIVNGRASVIGDSQLPQFRYINEHILQDHRGDWWIGTSAGLFWIRGPDLHLRRSQRLAAVDGTISGPIKCIYEDQAGRVWVSADEHDLLYLNPERRAEERLERAVASDPLPAPLPSANMTCDRNSDLWLSGWLSGRFVLARFKDGMIKTFQPIDKSPGVNPRAMFVDSRGWLWIGDRSNGVFMTKDPASDSPEFINFSTANRMASDTVYSITEDDKGRIYFGTFKGLDRLDPVDGEIRHFGSKDGLSGDLISHCMRDSRGNIWVSTSTGLSKLDPRADSPTTGQPSIFLSRVQIAGEDLPLAETGAVTISALELAASRNDLLIEYVGLSFQGEREIKYQYKLEGASADWSEPGELRSVNYGRLSPGRYRFMVRAINQQGVASAEPAVFDFRILPPIWLRWWFISFFTLLMAAAIYAVYRYRLRRLIELERVRTRIASDLHDDIGSNLSLIAGLSEMLGQQTREVDSRLAERLSQIAAVSRRSVDAMSDIVWAVNPRRDRLIDLSQRMRRFASDSFTARDIQFYFVGPTPQQNIKIGADVRREVFLVFKEGVNNIVRHSGCRMAEVTLQIDRRMLTLRLRDDGRGFDQAGSDEGQGLTSMRLRAEKLGGELQVISTAGAGTTVVLNAPL